MIRNGMSRKLAHQEQQGREAEDTKQLEEQWLGYPFPIQEMLKLHLAQHGLRSAHSITDILARYSQSLRDRLLGLETQEESCNTSS